MAMVKANITWSAKQITKMYNAGTLRFDNIIQRSYVWEQKRKSDLIHSMIEGYPIPPFYARRVDGKVYDFLDGKQRMSAIAGFINGDYTLIDVPEITYVNDEGEEITEDLNGVEFQNLPEVIQDTIKDYSLTIYYYENITDFQIREMFRKLNNGKPLSAKERNIANCVDIQNISELGKHRVFGMILTEKGIEQRKFIPIIMKSWVMLNEDVRYASFESKDFNELVSTVNTTEEERQELNDVFTKFSEVWLAVSESDYPKKKSVLKKMSTETNFVSLIPFIKKADEENVPINLLVSWIVNLFYGDVTVSKAYAEAASAGAAKNMNIKKRNDELEKNWNEFFKEDESGETDEVEEVEDEIEEDKIETETEPETEIETSHLITKAKINTMNLNHSKRLQKMVASHKLTHSQKKAVKKLGFRR